MHEEPDLTPPEYPELFSSKFHGVWIGKKTPFCLGSHPEPDPTIEHCYMPMDGTWYYDWTQYSLVFDLSIQATNWLKYDAVSIHREWAAWIHAKTPVVFKKLVLPMCICIDEGKDYGLPRGLFPVRPDFLKNGGKLIGREQLEIEYGVGSRVVDHWQLGPHHLWRDVETGKITRQWQPSNALYIHDPEGWGKETYEYTAPPQDCLNETIKIGCTADGLPDEKGVPINDGSAWDFNPKHWGRKRRCDLDPFHFGECEPCEGIGGMAYGDAADDITYPECTVVLKPEDMDEKDKIPPALPLKFKNTNWTGVVINQKTNPLCIGGYPGSDSTGPHCYLKFNGVYYYDWNKFEQKQIYAAQNGALTENLGVYHSKGTIWGIVHYVKDSQTLSQCVCINPGGPWGVEIYPVKYDFLKEGSRLVGREKMVVEGVGERVVDHWQLQGHNVFKDVETGRIIRIWLPWGSLDVFHPHYFVEDADDIDFETPPQACKDALVKIQCDKDLNPITPKHDL